VWDARRGGLLVRNPYFRGTPRSRPAGFVDRVEVRVRRLGTTEAQIAAVQRGAADLAVIAGAFGSYVTADRLRALVTDSPGRVHSAPVPTTDWMFLDVRRRPFDDIDVRRAINLAFDRARVVRLTGGPEVGQPACQIVPAAFPGHEPYCPYTASPSGAGAWTGPDLQRARRLVAASGRAGARIVVWMPPFRRAVGRYFTAVLNRLGFRATLRVPPGEGFGAETDDVLRAHASPQGWAADYLAPSTFLETNFACANAAERGGLNFSRLCDATLERRIDRALALSPAYATAAWAAAEHRLTDLAAAVPMTQRRAAVLVSRRVGNVQHHPQLFTLLDQMWVR
jgi:peptide/nickel transport system substrate-binding protein